MTAPVADPVVMPLALALKECLEREVAKTSQPPAHTMLRAGDQVEFLLSTDGQDECCEGMAWVRPASLFPSTQFPAIDETAQLVGVIQWAVLLEMGVVRCAPTKQATQIPTPEEWQASVQAELDDAAAMRRAICCLQQDLDGVPMLPGEWTPLTVEGGCQGGTMLVTVAAPACDCMEAT